MRGSPGPFKLTARLEGHGETFNYLRYQSPCIANISDADDFSITKKCMLSIGIDEKDQNYIYELLGGILHLGNIDFDPDDTEGQVGEVNEDKKDVVDLAAILLGMEQEEFVIAMRKQNMFVYGSVIVKTQSYEQVAAAHPSPSHPFSSHFCFF